MDRFGEDGIPESRLERTLGNQIDPPPEKPLQESLEIHVGVEGRLIELNEKVHIAPDTGLIPGGRAEKRKTSHAETPYRIAVLFEDPEDLIAARGLHDAIIARSSYEWAHQQVR